MPLSNQDLLTGITDAINSALDTSLQARFEALEKELDYLRSSNEKITSELNEKNNVLIELNKALIERRDSDPLAPLILPLKASTNNIPSLLRQPSSPKKRTTTASCSPTRSTATLASHVPATQS